MARQEIEIVNKLGLHARAAAKLVNAANRFEAEIFLEKNGQKVNGKSIMGVMMLAAGKGSLVTLHINGNDEQAALETLSELIAARFGEPE